MLGIFILSTNTDRYTFISWRWGEVKDFEKRVKIIENEYEIKQLMNFTGISNMRYCKLYSTSIIRVHRSSFDSYCFSEHKIEANLIHFFLTVCDGSSGDLAIAFGFVIVCSKVMAMLLMVREVEDHGGNY